MTKPLDNMNMWISELKQRNLLKKISDEVDPYLEITEISDRVMKKFGPAIFFEKVKGSEIPLFINGFGSEERMLIALNAKSYEEIQDRIREALKIPVPSDFKGKWEGIKKLGEMMRYVPGIQKKAPCQDIVINEGNFLDMLPILHCWPEDGGKFITLPCVVTKHPVDGTINVGMYRMQKYDHNTAGMHFHCHKDGKMHLNKSKGVMDVAVFIGGPPSVIYSATAPLPEFVDEYLFAGFIQKKGISLVKCITSDLLVPAEADIVLEGTIDTEELKEEGPFGDHTGFYSRKEPYPVFRIHCMTMRKKAVYPATIVGKPPMEDCYMGKATERIFLPMLQQILPEIQDLDLPLEGVFHNCAIVSLKKEYPGQGKKIMNAMWGIGQMMVTKTIFVVDSDTNVHNYSEVAWKVFNNVDPQRDVVISYGPADDLEHASGLPRFGSKMGFDATRKFPEEAFGAKWPEEIKMSESVKKSVNEKWNKWFPDL